MDRWIQPELYDCEVMGHQWEHDEEDDCWFCSECEDVYGGE